MPPPRSPPLPTRAVPPAARHRQPRGKVRGCATGDGYRITTKDRTTRQPALRLSPALGSPDDRQRRICSDLFTTGPYLLLCGRPACARPRRVAHNAR